MAENIINQRFKSNTTNEFTVLRKSTEKQGTNHLYEIEFDEINGIKYKTLVKKGHIISGGVRNPYYPTTAGIGYTGNATARKNKIEYIRWANMINRCHNPKNPRYKDYGAKGIVVCERWHSFENFLHDFPLLDGYDEKNLDNLDLDKDIKIPGNKIYSFETCILIFKSENLKEMNKRKYQK